MRMTFFALILLSVAAARAQTATVLSGGTNVTYSSTATNVVGLSRQTVSVTADGVVVDRSGTIVAAADTIAVDKAAAEVGGISEAARDAMRGGLEGLYTATQNMASASYAIRLSVRPETERANLTSYVVDVDSDGTTDTLWVWYNRELAVAPNRSQTYEYFGGYELAKCTWTDSEGAAWVPEGTTRTVNGRTWTGVHKCVCERPAWARGLQCQHIRNDTWGGNADGFAFGNIVPLIGGAVPYTGWVTNRITGAKMAYFENGFAVTPPEGE